MLHVVNTFNFLLSFGAIFYVLVSFTRRASTINENYEIELGVMRHRTAKKKQHRTCDVGYKKWKVLRVQFKCSFCFQVNLHIH